MQVVAWLAYDLRLQKPGVAPAELVEPGQAGRTGAGAPEEHVSP